METKCYCGHTNRCDCGPEIDLIKSQELLFKDNILNIRLEDWDYTCGDSNYRQKQLQKEKEDFAVKFSEWVESLRSSEIDTIDYDLYLRYNTEELLEIYKKEIK